MSAQTEQWRFEKGDILRDENGQLWHVTNRWQDIDTGRRKYHIEDMTHTAGEDRDADWFESHAEPTGENITGSKPATVFGYRVNGLLVGPEYAPEKLQRDRERGRGCLHEETPCPHCGTADSQAIDIIQSYSDDEASVTVCRVCGHTEEV